MIPTREGAARRAVNTSAGAPPRTPSHPAADPNPASKEKTVINAPFNDTQIRTEAAEYEPGEDPLVVFCEMAGRMPWAALGADEFNEAHSRVLALIDPA